VAHGFNTALSGSQYIPPALPEVIESDKLKTVEFGKDSTVLESDANPNIWCYLSSPI
jgi:hypothetical protein